METWYWPFTLMMRGGGWIRPETWNGLLGGCSQTLVSLTITPTSGCASRQRSSHRLNVWQQLCSRSARGLVWLCIYRRLMTACLATWRDDGCKEAQRSFDARLCSHGGIFFDVFGTQHTLPATQAYKHVGCWTRANTSNDMGIALGCAVMRSAAQPLRKHVLRNDDIDPATRVGSSTLT